jgi:uncharacterized protein involved in type VI secretion and phage assembly
MSADTGTTNCQQFLGKYRGTVVQNLDPMNLGRIQAMVPDVSNVVPTTWAMPCLPVGGAQMGLFTVPPIGAGVFVEFEQGDPDYPIWTGSFWGSAAEVPSTAQLTPATVPRVTIQTPLQNALTVSDAPGAAGGILLKTATGAMISVTDTGLIITNGKGATIAMNGASITVTCASLTVL